LAHGPRSGRGPAAGAELTSAPLPG